MACNAFYGNYLTRSDLTETHLVSRRDLTFLFFPTDTSNICIECKKPLIKRGKVKQNKQKAFPLKCHFLELKKHVLAESTHL